MTVRDLDDLIQDLPLTASDAETEDAFRLMRGLPSTNTSDDLRRM